MSKIGCIILAAGLSSRMGQSKLLLDWGDKTVIQHIVEQAVDANYHQVVVIIGHEQARLQAAIGDLPVTVVFNPDYAAGEMLSSLKVGLRYMQNHLDIDGVAVMLGDLPLLTPNLHNAIIEHHQTGMITIPTHDGTRGHPIVFDKKFWCDILDLDLNSAPREIIHRNKNSVVNVALASDAIYSDIDTPEAYQACLRKARQSN